MIFTERTGLNLYEVNEAVLKEWDKQDLFHKSMSEREGCPSFVFLKALLQLMDTRVFTM